MNKEHIHIIHRDEEVNTDHRGLYLTIKDEMADITTLPTLEKIMGKDQFDLFSWKEHHDGTNFQAVALLKNLQSSPVFEQIKTTLSDHAIILKVEEVKPLEIESGQATKEDELGSYDSSWFWPLNKRLPREKYTNPHPIKIAQADTGISRHPNVIEGYVHRDSMDFFLPKAERKGRGVICWNADHPAFISHGTGTGGLVIGQPAGDLKLHGMSPKDVVQLVPCRVSNSVVLDDQDVARLAECINWAIDEGIRVVTISLGSIATDNDKALVPLTRAIERAYKSGVIVCCASGQLAPGMVWPAIYAMKGWSICCAPSNEDNKPSPQSIWPMFWNGYVTIAAPGEYMPKACWKDDNCSSNEARLEKSEGSSYSTAYTASVAALWWALNHEQLSKMDKRDIVPLFRYTLAKTCNRWNGTYGKNFGPGILDPNKVLQPLRHLEDYSLECTGAFNVKQAQGGTYKNATLYAHGSGSIHVIDPIFVEGKLTLRAESSGTISMSGTIICRELEIICKHGSTIHADDLEYYDSCKVDVYVSSTCNLHIVAEGPMTGAVTDEGGLNFWTGATFIARVFWRHGKKHVDVRKGNYSTVTIHNDWKGRWA